jgi:hypothetical protein
MPGDDASPFALWNDLKINTRVRLAMWLKAGLPLSYAPIENNITMAENSAKFRHEALQLQPQSLMELKALIKEQLALEGHKDLKPRQVPERRWSKKLKGARPISWVPGPVPKEDSGQA